MSAPSDPLDDLIAGLKARHAQADGSGASRPDSEAVARLVDGAGDAQTREQLALRALRDPVARAQWRLFLAADAQVAALRRRRIQRLGGGVLALIAAAAIVAMVLWPQCGPIHVEGATAELIGRVSTFTARPGERLRVDASHFPDGARVRWVARHFARKWPMDVEAGAGEPVAVDALVKKPGAYLIVVTTEPAATVDALLDRWQLPKDLGEQGVAVAARRVADAMQAMPPPDGMLVAVCALLL